MSPVPPEEELPSFRRPTADDARTVAVWLFQQGERVDMNTVAARLDIGRSTLYRWVGDREKLIDHAILESIGHIWQRARHDAQGGGIDQALDAAARFMHGCIDYEPLTAFARREPNLALRVLLDPDGLVNSALQANLFRATSSAAPHLAIPPETFGVLAMTATALVWANVAAGREPDITATIGIMRTVLSAHQQAP
ncbi:QsdR family transcriptional regulator [Nocardia sp. NPDC057272]|uniref:QsdR family transcriptional regulator n=1 Tax=Nocardia sp. NPDC057272 TaxID=3346079 RepID=UPI003640A14D